MKNAQVKNLVDILTNFIQSEEWVANEDIRDLILESSLLPLLEAVFRNGSWVELAKEHEVTHSYMGKFTF